MTTASTLFGAGGSAPFDPTIRLPEGITVLEASAGTGKTHTVASIVVTEVADGRPLDELLVVTFTRKATGTLRERVWQRLSAAANALDIEDHDPDPVLAHLRRGTAAEVAARRINLERAVSDFDAATIATTHGFCQQVLAGLGVAGDSERELQVVDDVTQLVTDAVDDLFIRRFHGGGEQLFTRQEALVLTNAVVRNPDARIGAVDDDEAPRMRRRFAQTLRDRIIEQKRHGRLITYDDLLTRLADSIADPVRGEMVVERLQRRFSMAIVDEFQDTDTVQWRILQKAFGAVPSRLVLVGDPKQAVYAFRGGDVHAYLEATRQAGTRLSLDVSWRADQPLLDALDALLDGAQLGDPTIEHRRLLARPGAHLPRLLGPAVGAPLHVRIVDRESKQVALTPRRYAEKPSTRRFIAADVASEAVRMLSSGSTLVERDLSGAASAERALRPGDLAVLVRRHTDAELVRAALRTAGVPAVVHGGPSVLTMPAAGAWLDLLRSLEAPASALRLRSVALGPFLGWDATALATATDDDWESVDERVHDWARVLRRRGVAALLRRIEAAEGLTARLLARVDGEAQLSDLWQVAELLDAWQAGHPSSIASLVGWLSEQMTDAADSESARRRLASDADAVAVQTIHGAKGLEFGVVLLPSMWEGPWVPDDEPPLFHDTEGRRSIGVGGGGRLFEHQRSIAARERYGEELRLLYVALTRARHRVVLWWATGGDAGSSPFARMLLGRTPGTGAIADQLDRSPKEDDVRAALTALADRTGGAVSFDDASGDSGARYVGGIGPAVDLGVARFDRAFDTEWVRTSYTGLTAAAHEQAPVTSVEVVEVDEAAKVDEPPTQADGTAPGGFEPGAPGTAATLPLGEVPGGARLGTLVHSMLEETDFSATDLTAQLWTAALSHGAHRLIEGQVEALVAGLATAIGTPLGPLFDEQRLCDLTRNDRLDELGFDLPLAGGDAPSGSVTMDAIAAVFATLPVDDPLAGYHERLLEPILSTSVHGFLTGSIDLVARVGGRHVVIDYKTNKLAQAGEPLTPWHYRPEALAAAMVDNHYPLQAALYEVAVHRYLRWRLSGYEPERHLGGVAYLFIRGMAGPDSAGGVFSWHPPAGFVAHLSDVLDGSEP